METICIKIKIRNESLEGIRIWFQTLINRSEETLRSLNNENVFVESIFLDELEGEDSYLIYYMKADDLDHAREIAKKSTAAIDQYHKECKKKFCGERKRLELLANFDRI